MTKSQSTKKNYLPALLLTILWWILLGVVIAAVEPEVIADYPVVGSYGFFFALLFLAIWFTTSLLLANTRRGIIVASGVVIFGYLRLWKQGSFINGLLLAGFLTAVEIYFSSKRLDKPKDHNL